MVRSIGLDAEDTNGEGDVAADPRRNGDVGLLELLALVSGAGGGGADGGGPVGGGGAEGNGGGADKGIGGDVDEGETSTGDLQDIGT